ncbi:MAG: hypothetical protein MJ165_00990 [Alphaproteobacteria bacterium]|mgnify:CR=1 FL=1|nr:hypothetical protein [Alphaproteobacteria bacterium]
MRDDEKMCMIGIGMLVFVSCLIIGLQVCYREQKRTNDKIVTEMKAVKREYSTQENLYLSLISADSLRGSVFGNNRKAEMVSFNKVVNIDNIPMVEE